MKKIFEKDGFYLALFACVCLVAVGGIWFTNSNVNKLASDSGLSNKDDEIHLIDKGKDKSVPVTTDSDSNLENAKKKEKEAAKTDSKTEKLSNLGKNPKVKTEVVETSNGSYYKLYKDETKTQESFQGVSKNTTIVEVDANSEVKSLLAGIVKEVSKEDQTVKVESKDSTIIIYNGVSNLKVSKGDSIKEGQILGNIKDNISKDQLSGVKEGKLERLEMSIEAFKGKKEINPDDLLK